MDADNYNHLAEAAFVGVLLGLFNVSIFLNMAIYFWKTSKIKAVACLIWAVVSTWPYFLLRLDMLGAHRDIMQMWEQAGN